MCGPIPPQAVVRPAQDPAQDPGQNNYVQKSMGAPREETPKKNFENQNKDATKVLKKKQNSPYRSLIGKIAENIKTDIYGNRNTISYVVIDKVNNDRKSFHKKINSGDIMANLGPHSSYESIVDDMIKNRENSLDTAVQMLKNLSLSNKREPYELFDNLGSSAKNLMAALICEAIRFNDDGACARWAIRIVINEFKYNNNKDGFLKVFGTDDKFAIFANDGGKQRMINQFVGYAGTNDPFFEKDLKKLQQNIDFFSDDEDENRNNLILDNLGFVRPDFPDNKENKLSGRLDERYDDFSPHSKKYGGLSSSYSPIIKGRGNINSPIINDPNVNQTTDKKSPIPFNLEQKDSNVETLSSGCSGPSIESPNSRLKLEYKATPRKRKKF